MTDLEKAKALIAIAEQTYIENYYGDNLIHLFNRNQVASSNDSDQQSTESIEG